MEQLRITGGRPLQGEIRIQGSKNGVLPILAATLLARDTVELRRCPRLRDVETSIRILRALGCRAAWEGDSLIVDTASMTDGRISMDLMREMRSSVVFLGAILARRGQALCGMPGGCELGPRPIDLHLRGLRILGAEITDRGGELCCKACKLCGREIVLDTPSVGATENLMLAGCGADGTTIISNAAREPEIVDLQNFLNACGAQVRGAGGGTVTIRGMDGGTNPNGGAGHAGNALHGCTYTVLPDRIVAATYLCCTASAGGTVFLRDAREEHLTAVTELLRRSGCVLTPDAAGIRCTVLKRLHSPGPVRTAPYPGFPTDAQAVLMAALLKARGSTMFEENLFESRYRHVAELARMGANIRVSGRVAVVDGVNALHGAAVECTDLRGGAALCAAALAAEGETKISALRHIDRGYEDIRRDLAALGAEISRENE